MATKRSTWIVLTACFGVLIFVVLHQLALSSDGYHFLDLSVRRAPQIQARLGSIEDVRLSYFGTLRLRAVGSDRWVTMTLNVTGSRGAATIQASAKRTGNTWVVTAASMDQKPISMN